MQRSDLEKLSRKELQALAKENGVKANLSNADIIAKLTEIVIDEPVTVKSPATPVETSIADVAGEEHVVVDVEPVVEAVIEQNAHISPVAKSACDRVEDVKVGDSVEVEVEGTWFIATIKRVNKKTVRVCLLADAEELSVKFTEVRPVATASTETASKMEVKPTEIVETETTTVEMLAPVEQAIEKEIQEEVAEIELPGAEDTSAMIVEETELDSGTNNTAAREVEVVVVAPVVEEAPIEVVAETAHAPPTSVSVSLPQAPPTPVSAVLDPPTPFAAARVSSLGWNFVLQDSAMKAPGPSPTRRKERRQARRSAMEQLAESMKMENLQAEADAEAVNMSFEDSSAEENATEAAPELVVQSEVVSVPVPEAVPAAVEPVTVATVPVAAVPVAPTPAAFVASTPAAPAPVAPSNANKGGDMLPRMNKAQIMRLGATQKKAVSTAQVPVESAAFTAKAAVARPSPAMTPNHRSSICTSAPSSVLNQPGAPFRRAATPLSGRASMLTTGTKRKMSDLGCSSANSTAPDFKNMHKKQFSSLKSIAECVDQDKSVGVRMTIAMESAMTKAKPTPAATSVAKPAANPFGRVVNKSASNTPSKAAPASATPAQAHTQASRPGSAVHTANHLLASKNKGNGSSNIVKSRTVTSFVSSAAPSSCGHNNLTSFVNNENSLPTHNAPSATSFLKGKDSVGAGKHRTVMLTGGSTIRQQQLTML